jgi:hypothetical protein
VDGDVPLSEDAVVEVAHATGAAEVGVGIDSGGEVGQACQPRRVSSAWVLASATAAALPVASVAETDEASAGCRSRQWGLAW